MNTKLLRIPKDASEPDLFLKMVWFSIAAHIALILFFGLKAALFPNESLSLDAAIKVDLVGLPDKVQALPEKSAPAPAPAVPVPPPLPAKVEPKVELKTKPVVLKPTKALDKIKKLEREEREKKVLDSLKEEVAQEEAKEERQAKLSKLLKGNAVSPGSALHGIAKDQFNEYLGALQNHVHEHWNLPEWLQNDTLKASVKVYIDYRGVVTKRVLVTSSGDSHFDDLALKAVDEAGQFPQPPPKFVDMVKVDGITLKFP
jgi:colicin import membrane protein